MLYLFADESGDQTTYAVGGLMAKAECWDAFVRDWNAVLGRNPPLPYWHQSKAFQGNPPFDRLSPSQRRRRSIRLASVLSRVDAVHLSVSMSKADYERHVKGKFAVGRSLDSDLQSLRLRIERLNRWPYHLPYFHVLEHVDRVLKKSVSRDRVRIVLEKTDSADRDSDIEATLWEMVALYYPPGTPNPIDSITFKQGKRADARPLEAADLLVWSMRNSITGTSDDPIRRELGKRRGFQDYRVEPAVMTAWVAQVNQRLAAISAS